MPSDDPIVIAPVAAPLSQRQPRSGGKGGPPGAPGSSGSSGPPGHRRRWWLVPSARAWLFSFTLLVLGAIAVYIFIGLPGRIEISKPVLAKPTGESRAPAAQTPPPFQALELERARQQAQEQLNDFMDLQLSLEQDLHVAAWGEAELARVKDLANTGDKLFLEARFEAAMDAYASAVADLAALAAKGAALFDAAIADGATALAERDPAAASAAFARAAAIHPDDPRVAAGAARAAKLPAITELLRESRRSILRGDYDRAHEFLVKARRLDPATAGLATRLAEVNAARAEERRKAVLSEGFTALEAGDHSAALAAFGKVLGNHPGDAAALTGRQLATRAWTLAEIDRQRAAARAQIEAEDWTAALASYDAVLALDASLQFARDGKLQLRERVALIRAMDRILADPNLLSTDQEFAAARDVLARARAEARPGGRIGARPGGKFAARLERFREVVERGAVPVALVLMSDNATEVTIQKIGAIGTFARTELSLRPGRYVIIGSRDGCRDIRKEITLAAGMAPVDIRCAERL